MKTSTVLHWVCATPRTRLIFRLVLAQFMGLTAQPVSAADPAAQTLAQEQARTELPELIKVAQVRNLSPREATRGYPVWVRGVVTHSDPAYNTQFVQDDSAGIYVELGDPVLSRLPDSGQNVEIWGLSTAGKFAPGIRIERIQLLGEGAFPPTKFTTLQALMTGSEDSQWVALMGVVRSQFVENDHTVLTLARIDGLIKVTVPEAAKRPAPRNFIDAGVEVRGVCTTVFNERRQLQRVELQVPTWTQVDVMESAPEALSRLPLRDVSELLQFHPGMDSLHRSRVQGLLTLRQEDGSFFVQDVTGGIRVQPRLCMSTPSTGAALEIVGFPTILDKLPVLQDAVVKPVPAGRAVEPVELVPESALNESLHARLVRIEGRIIGSSGRTGEEILTVQSGTLVIDAILKMERGAAQLPKMIPGSVVRLTGVYTARLDDSRTIRSFQVLLRDRNDVALISRPPWWTPGRVLWVLGGLGSVLCVALGWVGLLRKQVQRRTRDLSEEIVERKRVGAQLRKLSCAVEQSPSSIIITDAKGCIQYVNPRFTKLAGYTSEEAIGKTPAILKSGKTPPAVYQRLWEVILAGGEWRGEIQNRKKNGELYWEFTSISPITDEAGAITHFVAVKEDITERKRTEEKFEQLHKQLLEASRQAGMAEVATSVLHNVGNVLNSINVSANLVTNQVKKSRAAKVARLADLLRDHAADLGDFLTRDPRGQQVPAYLAQLAEHLDQEQTLLLEEIGSLSRNVDHVKDIVAMQQAYAKISGVTETVKVTDLAEDALRMNAGALTRHEVQLVREYQALLPEITVEKHKVLQILVNLIRNAKYACDASGRSDKLLTVRATAGGDSVRIAIIDNGVGIPPENLTRIFNHGFTTRQDGHGFGLHSGALAAKELGGALRAHSDGAGRGSTFTLELPLATTRPPYG